MFTKPNISLYYEYFCMSIQAEIGKKKKKKKGEAEAVNTKVEEFLCGVSKSEVESTIIRRNTKRQMPIGLSSNQHDGSRLWSKAYESQWTQSSNSYHV